MDKFKKLKNVLSKTVLSVLFYERKFWKKITSICLATAMGLVSLLPTTQVTVMATDLFLEHLPQENEIEARGPVGILLLIVAGVIVATITPSGMVVHAPSPTGATAAAQRAFNNGQRGNFVWGTGGSGCGTGGSGSLVHVCSAPVLGE
ncbi:MAG: hypothetical protein FWF59_00450 [Turicibacter sp.]|nr:hypothetical protein [Turicibacter sp.]